MTEITNKYKLLAAIVATLLAIAAISTFIVNERLEQLENTVVLQLTEQKALLATIAETTARNGADSVTESIITDCAPDNRVRFDELLGSLDSGLQRFELIELEQLFGLCGGFFAERKALMIARLSREIEVFDVHVQQLSDITGQDESDNQQLTDWKQLAEGERTQSVLFSKLVSLQKQIIDELLAGNSADSEEIVTILVEVRETREALLLAKTQTDTLRNTLTSL